MVVSYKDLIVYQKSYEMAKKVYEVTKLLPTEEQYGIISQMRRAGLSIPLNIAEGYGRKVSAAEFKRYLTMGIGSANEMSVLIAFCKDLGYLNEAVSAEMLSAYEEIGKMLTGLCEKWR